MKASAELHYLEQRGKQLEAARTTITALESAATAGAVAPFRVNVVLEPTGCKRRVYVIGDAGVVLAQAEGSPAVLHAVSAFEGAGGRVAYSQRSKKRGLP